MLLTLSKKTVEKKLRQLRKLNWEDPQVVSYVKTCFLCTNNFKFTNMDIIAYMIHELVRYYPDFSVDVIDGVFELVKFGLEQNAYKHNQQRISAVRLVGELYNYKMIQSNVVFDTLYTIVCYGHENNIPRYMVSIPLDYTHDFFRVRLCCTLLKTCGQYFMTGKAGKRLGCFMCFLQMYLYSKEPYPADISVMVTEILETYCPTTKRFDCYIDAAESLIEILSNEDSDICPRLENAIGTIRMEIQRINTIDTNISQVVFENAPADHHEYAGESKFVYQKSISAHGYAQQSNDMSFSNTLPNNASSSNTLPNDEVTSCDSSNSIKEYPDSTCEEGIEAEELKDFDEMYNRLIQENEQCPMRASKSTCPVLPRGVVGKFHHKAAQEISENSNEITFIMLTKKNNKHVTLPLSLPKNTPFAANTLSRFIAEQEEKRQLKQLVLDYEQREISNIESEFAILENNEDGGHNAGPTHDCMSFNPNHRRPVSNSQDNSRCYPHQNQSDSPKRSSKASRGR